METTWTEVEAKGMKFMVSSSGQIASIARKSAYSRLRDGKIQAVMHHCKSQILAQYVNRNGYLEVSCKTDGVRRKFSAHRLIGLAFVPGYFKDATINHINGDKLDNRVENLEWVSLSKNTALEWEAGLINLRGELQPGAKLNSRQVRIIRKALSLGMTSGELSELCPVSSGELDNIKSGARWQSVI